MLEIIKIEKLVKGLKEQETFQVKGVGTFKVKHTKERTGWNPKTGEAILIPAGIKVVFKAHNWLLDELKNSEEDKANDKEEN